MSTFKKKVNSKKANVYVNYQQRATEFSVGDMALPFYADSHQAGRVVAVYPAIGMVDVEFPNGSKRYPVEDLQLIDPSDYWINGSHNNTVPGGAGQPPLANSPYKSPNKEKYKDKETGKETKPVEIQKKALYWGARDRKYFANREELNTNFYTCPRCKEVHLKKCVYKRESGSSIKLYGCPQCLFLIRRSDIQNCEEF